MTSETFAVATEGIRRYTETDASVHDSQTLGEVLNKTNTSNEVRADSAYRSVETEAKLKYPTPSVSFLREIRPQKGCKESLAAA